MEKKNNLGVNKNYPSKKNEGMKELYRTNEKIRVKEVRLVGENVEQ